MAASARTVAYTSQMLSFTRSQLAFMANELNDFQLRVVKHAFLTQIVDAFVSYLDELEILSYAASPRLNLKNFILLKLEAAQHDFRVNEIALLLKEKGAENWLQTLLFLFDESQQGTVVEKKHLNDEEASKSNLIIAVDTNAQKRQWWQFDKTELSVLLTELEALIARQREFSVEA